MKLNGSQWYLVIASAFALMALTFSLKRSVKLPAIHDIPEKPVMPSPKVPARYTVKQFPINDKIKGLSANQIRQHKILYAGYVKARNQIEDDLATINRTDAKSRTYSKYRALKVAETYAVNGSILHELYFENLATKPTTMGPLTEQLITKSFGTVEAFKQDFMASANSARGWVLASYQLDDGRLHNYVLEEHNEHVPVLAMPLIVLDVYEHAYMIEFGIQRTPYLKVFWENIDWDVVEERIKKWVQPLSK